MKNVIHLCDFLDSDVKRAVKIHFVDQEQRKKVVYGYLDRIIDSHSELANAMARASRVLNTGGLMSEAVRAALRGVDYGNTTNP